VSEDIDPDEGRCMGVNKAIKSQEGLFVMMERSKKKM